MRTIVLPLAALAMLAGGASAAQADVLEIGARGAVWTAGGPAAPVSAEALYRDNAPLQETLPETLAPHSAGPAQWQARVAELAAKYDLSPRLIEALVWQESRWRPGAVSPAGARGLAQLMPGTARELGVDPHVPDANLEGGARYLRQQLDRFEGDLEKALAAYNAGPGQVIAARGIPRIRETQNYVVSIMARLAAPVRQ